MNIFSLSDYFFLFYIVRHLACALALECYGHILLSTAYVHFGYQVSWPGIIFKEIVYYFSWLILQKETRRKKGR